MKHLILAFAGASLLATTALPARAYDETPQAIEAATDAAQEAREDMLDVFGEYSLDSGEYVWRNEKAASQVTRLVISLSDQMVYAYRDGELVGVSTISSGKEGKPTPVGIFPILDKKRDHRSRKYDNAPMPFMQRLDDYGIALHGGNLPGYPASHGCVRLPHKFASQLFAATRVGTPVMIGA